MSSVASTATPLCCDRCKKTDGGPFYKLSVPGTTVEVDTLICQRCCDELHIPVFSPGFIAREKK